MGGRDELESVQQVEREGGREGGKEGRRERERGEKKTVGSGYQMWHGHTRPSLLPPSLPQVQEYYADYTAINPELFSLSLSQPLALSLPTPPPALLTRTVQGTPSLPPSLPPSPPPSYSPSLPPPRPGVHPPLLQKKAGSNPLPRHLIRRPPGTHSLPPPSLLSSLPPSLLPSLPPSLNKSSYSEEATDLYTPPPSLPPSLLPSLRSQQHSPNTWQQTKYLSSDAGKALPSSSSTAAMTPSLLF